MHLIATLHQPLMDTRHKHRDVGTDLTTGLRIALGEKLQTLKFSRIYIQVQKEDQKQSTKLDLVAQWTNPYQCQRRLGT